MQLGFSCCKLLLQAACMAMQDAAFALHCMVTLASCALLATCSRWCCPVRALLPGGGPHRYQAVHRHSHCAALTERKLSLPAHALLPSCKSAALEELGSSQQASSRPHGIEQERT